MIIDNTFWINLVVLGLVLLAFHWEWREQSEVKHDLPELSEIERRKWLAKMKLAKKSCKSLQTKSACKSNLQKNLASKSLAKKAEKYGIKLNDKQIAWRRFKIKQKNRKDSQAV